MPEEKLLTSKELATYLGVAPYTVAHYRITGTGPQYIKLGRIIRYRLSDVRVWLDNKTKLEI